MNWSKTEIEELCREAQDRVNQGVAKTLMGRLASEEPPNDPRHLTDTRTRVSTLLEYALGYEANSILAEREGGNFVSCVLWNVFPDLLIRSSGGEAEAGLEIKALHTAAEEKSANLSTPLSRIRAGQDFLVIMIWGWDRDDSRDAEMRFPRIHFTEVFDAHIIARIRDYTWLLNQSGRTKGIDINTPFLSVEGSDSDFKAEEGNLGKLMRISFSENSSEALQDYEVLKEEGRRFSAFQARVLGKGLTEVFREVCFELRTSDMHTNDVIAYPSEPTRLGHCLMEQGGCLALWGGPRIRSVLAETEATVGDAVIWLSSKLNWKVYSLTADGWIQIGEGKKAENSIREIDSVILAHAAIS
jgi:hypothetical protein